MIHQVNIFLLLFGALQGWLLSLWFLRNHQKERSNIYIGMLLFTVGLQLTSKVITKMWLMDNAHLFYILSYKLPYLIGPLLYLYCKAKINKDFNRAELLHFIPFVVSCVLILLRLKVWGVFLFPHVYTDAVWQAISLGIYGFLALRISSKNIHPFIYAVAAAEFIIIVTLATMVMYYGRFPDVRLLFLVLTVLIYWLTYKMISRSGVFLGSEASVVALNFQRNPKYSHSSLKVEVADRIEQQLNKMMHQERLYLDSSLTVDSLAVKLSTTRHYLSQVLNERLKKTYADYLNELRLEESRKRLSDPSNYRFTIAAIAQDSGFSSVSSFNDVFKKRYGITPSKFREQYLKKMTA
jgi:AraC-like DNA-binding protein